MKLLESKPVNFVEAKNILDKKGEDLGYEQKITLEYLRKYVKVDDNEIKKLSDELKKELPDLKDYQVVMIIEILPKDKDDVKTLFMKERTNLTDEQIDKILKILDNLKLKK